MGGCARAPGPAALPWVGRQGSGTSRGAQSAELLIGHPGDTGSEAGEAAERSPVKRGARATWVCRDDAVLSAYTTRAKETSALTFLAISDPVSLKIRKGCCSDAK